MLLDVAHYSFHLALGARAVRTAGFGHEAVMAGQLLEAFVEAHGAGHVRGHCGLGVVDPYLPGDATEPGEGPRQALVGVLGIAARCRHDVEATGVAQDTDGDVDSPGLAADRDDDVAPVMLQLPGGLGFEPHGGASGLDVGAQDTNLAVVSQSLELAKDDHGVEDAGAEQLVHGCHVGLELGVPFAAACPGRRPAALEGASDRWGMSPEALGNVALETPW